METLKGKVVKFVDDLYKEYNKDTGRLIREKIALYKLKKNKKINTVAMFYKRYRNGGVERVMSLLIPMYIEMGYKVVLITEENSTDMDYKLPEKVKRYTICNSQNIVNGNIDYCVRAEQLFAILEEEKVDVLSYHDIYSQVLPWDILIAKQCNVNCILTKHNLFTQEYIDALNYTNLYSDIFCLFDKVIVLSSAERQYWNTYGVDVEYIFNPANEELSPNIVKEKRDIVWVGRFEIKQKRYLDIVGIMEYVVKKYPEIKLVVYGEGCSVENNILKREIEKKGLLNNIVLAGYKSDVREIYKNARIHLVTSAFESYCMVIHESKMCGIPLVVYDMPYLELLKSKKGYISVENGNYEEAANAIISILDDEKFEKMLSIEAVESAEEFSWDKLKEKWRKLFEQLEHKHNPCGYSNDLNKVILDTLSFHSGRAFKKYWIYKELIENKDLTDMYNYIAEKMSQFEYGVVVYPYGMMGKKVVNYLKDRNIYVDYVIDNSEVKDNIKSIKVSQLENEDRSKKIYIITNNNPNIYDEIRTSIRRYVPEENIYDMYSEEKMEYLIRNEFI